MNSRRQFLLKAPLVLAGTVAACRVEDRSPPPPGAPPPGAPPTFGAAPVVGPEVSASTFAEAEKLVQVEMSRAEREMAAESWRASMAALYERRTGPRKVDARAGPRAGDPLDSAWHGGAGARRARSLRSRPAPIPDRCPSSDADIAFAPVTRLSRWIETRKLTSERLTADLSRRASRGSIPKLRCVITLTRDSGARAGRSRPTRRSPPGNIAVRCTASRGARRICSTPRESRPRTAPSRIAIACPPRTRP